MESVKDVLAKDHGKANQALSAPSRYHEESE